VVGGEGLHVPEGQGRVLLLRLHLARAGPGSHVLGARAAEDGPSVMTGLNWRPEKEPYKHWGGGQRRPCRVCRGLTFLLDEEGRFCHKVCAEEEIAREGLR
jgi:hypothetical protein